MVRWQLFWQILTALGVGLVFLGAEVRDVRGLLFIGANGATGIEQFGAHGAPYGAVAGPDPEFSTPAPGFRLSPNDEVGLQRSYKKAPLSRAGLF